MLKRQKGWFLLEPHKNLPFRDRNVDTIIAYFIEKFGILKQTLRLSLTMIVFIGLY